MGGFISDGDIIYTNAAGTVRVRVVHDDSPGEPYFDGAMPTLRIDSNSYGSTAEHVYGGTDYGFDAAEAWRRLGIDRSDRDTAEVFERYVRIFHGGTTFHAHNLGISREYGYVTFDTVRWAEAVGAPSARIEPEDTDALAVLGRLDETIPSEVGTPDKGYPTGLAHRAEVDEAAAAAAVARLAELGLAARVEHSEHRRGWIRRDGAEENFAEYRAYLDGECYGLVLEHKVALHITKADLAFPARPWEVTDTEDWTEEDSIWGIYGDDQDNAVSSARGNFDLDEPATV